MISPTLLAPSLADHLVRQRWFGAKDRTIDVVRVLAVDVLRPEWPALVRVEAEVSLSGTPDRFGGDPAVYQLLLGLRPAGETLEFLAGHEYAALGEFDTTLGPATVYDALVDSELALALVELIAPEHDVKRVRPVGSEQSNTSLIYDDAMILKVFRRLGTAPNPDVTVTESLARAGFTHVAEPLATWRDGGHDLGFLQRYLAGSTEGWAMALTSLRDLYADPADPAQAGGDFGSEAERLGEVTAALHGALADAFGTTEADVGAWADGMDAQIDRVLGGAVADGARAIVDRLRAVRVAVPAIRVHGDYHLGQVMRTDAGWFVLDFEGEPTRPVEERTRPSSAAKDIAGMLRSFHYAAAVAMTTAEDDVTGVARAWEARNRACFLAGYWRRAANDGGAFRFAPEDAAARDVLLAAFELDKAVYELAYERAHRPDWAAIPEAALRRLTGTGDPGSAPTPSRSAGGLR